jgi:hypothetical protein
MGCAAARVCVQQSDSGGCIFPSGTDRGIGEGRWSGQMLKMAITLATLAAAASFASWPAFAKSGHEGGGGGAGKVSATTPVNKPAATPKTIDKSSSNLLKHSVTGKHYQQTQ